MKAKHTEQNVTRRLSVWAVVVAGVLMVPLLTNAPWTKGDFVFAGIVLFGLAIIYEFVTRKMSNKLHRIAIGLGLMGMIVLIIGWAASGP